MRCAVILSLWAALVANHEAGAATPSSVVAWVDQDGFFDIPEFSVVLRSPGRTEPVLRRPMTAQAATALSRDRQRVFVVSMTPDNRMQVDELDAADLRLRSSRTVQTPFFWSVETTLAQHPTRPQVLMWSRCWWLDLGTGEWVETPQTLGVTCSAYAGSDGLSASGRLLLLEDQGDDERERQIVLVDVANPRVPLQVLPWGAGPVLDDDSGVLVRIGSQVELHPITGSAATRQFAIPSRWTDLQWLGAHRGAVYGRGFDWTTRTAAIVRLDVQSGAWTTLAEPVALGFDANVDFLGHWALFSSPAAVGCFLDCVFTDGSELLLDIDSGAIVEAAWSTGGTMARGRSVLAPVPTIPVATVSTPLAVLLLIALVWIVTRPRFAGADVA